MRASLLRRVEHITFPSAAGVAPESAAEASTAVSGYLHSRIFAQRYFHPPDPHLHFRRQHEVLGEGQDLYTDEKLSNAAERHEEILERDVARFGRQLNGFIAAHPALFVPVSEKTPCGMLEAHSAWKKRRAQST